MKGVVQSIYRHPVKGFTPESLNEVKLRAGAGLPFDRAFAVEDGPSGFDPDAPVHISKMRFAVLAKIPEVARIRTRFEDASEVLHAETPGAAPIAAKLTEEAGREAFATWLTDVLGEHARGPLRVLQAPEGHRFYDDDQGFVSLINLATVRDLEQRAGRKVDPLRFRANLYVEGWPAWAELDMEGGAIALGAARGRVHRAIPRCVATHVDPAAGVRDLELLEVLRRGYGHVLCGVYVHIESGGKLRAGDHIIGESALVRRQAP